MAVSNLSIRLYFSRFLLTCQVVGGGRWAGEKMRKINSFAPSTD